MLFEKLFVEKSVQDSKVSQSFQRYFKNNGLPVETINDITDLDSSLNLKRNLLLSSRKGGFVNACPCSPHVIPCVYQNINLIEGCPFTCNYCALDFYLSSPVTKVFCNLEAFEQELDLYLKNRSEIRMGTGELSDSLLWEPLFPYSQYLMDLFKKYPQSILEFKTKSNEIDHFLDVKDVPGNVLISWSLNTKRKILEEEKDVALLKERFSAAQKAAKKGFKVGFHFDPIYYYEGCLADYFEVIDAIFEHVSEKSIGWISLGVIRFSPVLREILIERDSKINEMELFPSSVDGKMRLFYPLRYKVLNALKGHLQKYTNKIYLCMEPLSMWQDLDLDYKHLNHRIFKDFFK